MDVRRPTAEALSRYGRAQRALELSGIALFLLLLGVNAVSLELDRFLLPCAVLAWLAADLLSGVAHWVFDSFGRLDTPLVGPAFIRPFREHHADPHAMTRHDFVETNGSSCLACVPLLMAALFMQEMPFSRTLVVFLCLGILVTNQCHKWAHMDRVPRAVASLQGLHLVLKAETHRRHHIAPFRSHYCTASGWMNPLLDYVLLRARPGSYRRRAAGSAP